MKPDGFDTKGCVIRGGRWGIDWQASISHNGCPLAQVRSALIKEIRRGNEEAALYWMLEMAAMPAEISEAMWADLAVFSHEDVGLANPQATGVVIAAKAVYDLLPTDDRRRELTLAQAVCYLARSKKTRYVTELLGHVTHARTAGMRLTVPDYAIDMHTNEGRAMGRGLVHYLTDAAALNNENKSFPAQYRDMAIERAKAK